MDQIQSNPGQQAPQKPDSYMVWAVLSTILCCLPFGIIAIINASKVDDHWYAGRYNEALAAAAAAKKWTLASVITSIVVSVLYVLFVFLMMV